MYNTVYFLIGGAKMSALNYNISKRTRTLVQLALLTAVIILMGFTPLGFLKIGTIEITFIVIPVAIGAVMLGQKGGAILGLVFGLVSFFQCFGYSQFGVFLFGINPFFTAILCIIPRILCGWLPGLLFEVINKKTKSNTVPCLVASLACPIFNTIFFVLFFILMFGMNPAVLEAFGTTTVFGIILGLVTLNAVIEASVGAVIGFSISKALTHILPKAKQ